MKQKKPKTWATPLHKIAEKVIKFFIRPIYCIRYGYKPVKANLPKDEPCIIFCNHQTFADQFFVCFSFNYPVYAMASERIFNLGIISKLIVALTGPIQKKKSKADIMAVKNCAKVLKEGGKVLIFPEGNCTYDGRPCYVSVATAKMAKMLKVPIVIYNLKGGYGAKPRWGRAPRKGKFTGEIVGKIMPEEYLEMSAEELNKKITNALAVNERFPEIEFKSKKRAEYLEKVLYYCPNCKKWQTLYSKGAYVYCKECGFKAEYTLNLTLNSESAITPKDVAEWYDLQASALLKSLNGKVGTIFKDEQTKLSSFGNGKTNFICKGEIAITNKQFIAGGKAFDLDKIEAVTVQQNSALIFYVDDVSYFVKGGKRFNPLKYMHAFYMLKFLSNGGNYEQPIGDVYLGL